MTHINTHPHKFQAHLQYAEHGLEPYFAMDSIRKKHNGSHRTEFQYNGETWGAFLAYKKSGFSVPENGKTPNGTPFKLQSVPEFKIFIWNTNDTKIDETDDENPWKQANHSVYCKVSPRWQGMETSVPEGFGEGIDIDIQGSNIEFTEYPELIQAGIAMLGMNSYYLDPSNIHENSNITDAERYARIHRDHTGPIHARQGPINQIARLLEGDRHGTRKLEETDVDDHGNRLPGYRTKAIIDSNRASEAVTHHRLGKEIKHYYAQEAAQKEPDDPMYHPKLEVAYQNKQTSQTVYFDEVEQVEHELEEMVLAVLHEAGLDVAVGVGTPFITRDYYWSPQNVDRVDVPHLDLPTIKEHQENIAIHYLGVEGVTPTQKEILKYLSEDGSDLSPKEVADAIDRHIDSVYTALNEAEELFFREYDHVSLSGHMAEVVSDALNDAEQALEQATNAAARAEQVAENGIDEQQGALVAFCERYGIEINSAQEARMVIRMHNVDNATAKINELYQLWQAANRDKAKLYQARVELGPNDYMGKVGEALKHYDAASLRSTD